jgi:hypothetical protein
MAIDKTLDRRAAFIAASWLSPEHRLMLTFQLCDVDRDFRKQAIRRQHPDWCEIEVIHELIRQAFLPEKTPAWLEKQMQERLDKSRTA